MATAFGDNMWPAPGEISPRRVRLTPEGVELPVKPEAWLVRPPSQESWLELERPSRWLASTDIGSVEWVGRSAASCSRNVTLPKSPWWHPSFSFNFPIHAVRVRLKALQGPQSGKPLWDVIFAGRPGSDFQVPNNAPPAGGQLPAFPEFCPPLRPEARYELRLTHEARRPDFDEVLVLRPKQTVQRKWVGQERPPPRPATEGPDSLNGALLPASAVSLNPLTGEPVTSLKGFL